MQFVLYVFSANSITILLLQKYSILYNEEYIIIYVCTKWSFGYFKFDIIVNLLHTEMVLFICIG